MAARTNLGTDGRARVIGIDTSGLLRQLLQPVWLRLAATSALQHRRDRLRVLGVPLAITASLTVGLWWIALPLALCAWWWSPRYTGLEWVGAVGRGVVGAVWALAGSSAFVSFPDHVLTVGVFWLLATGLLVGGSAALGRRVFHIEQRIEQRQGYGVQMRLAGVPSVRRRFAMHLTIQRMPETRKPDE